VEWTPQQSRKIEITEKSEAELTKSKNKNYLKRKTLSTTFFDDHRVNLHKALDKLAEIQAAENAHKQEMARIKASKPNMATVMGRLLDWIIYDLYGRNNERDEPESEQYAEF